MKVLGLVSLLVVAGCSSYAPVVRVYDGKVVTGTFVPPDAYASYLRGVIAEEGGDLAQARTAYQRALSEDEDPEIFARLGEVRCKISPADKDVDALFAKSLKVDPSHAGTMAAIGRCALLRGNDELAATQAAKAIAADPGNASFDALLVRAQAKRGDATSRDRVLELTKAHGERMPAWDALIAWARGHHDSQLLAQGLIGLLQVAPMRSAEVEAGAKELLGLGEKANATSVAVAVADSRRDLEVRGPRDPVVARLAVDEALARGDKASAQARATRGHIGVAEVAARAMLLEQPAIAEELAEAALGAEPSSLDAKLVLGRPGLGSTERSSAICVLLYLSRTDAQAKLAHLPLLAHDPLAGALGLELASRGIIPATDLAADERVELAVRRKQAPVANADLDARHELMQLSVSEPDAPRARVLFTQMAMSTDPIASASVARLLHRAL